MDFSFVWVCVYLSIVVRSKCPSYVGTTGILVQELKHVFKIITKENRLKSEIHTYFTYFFLYNWLLLHFVVLLQSVVFISVSCVCAQSFLRGTVCSVWTWEILSLIFTAVSLSSAPARDQPRNLRPKAPSTCEDAPVGSTRISSSERACSADSLPWAFRAWTTFIFGAECVRLQLFMLMCCCV